MADKADYVAWHGDEIIGAIGEAIAAALTGAGEVIGGAVADAIDTPYPPSSEVGEPPHSRSGRLHDAMAASSGKVERDGSDITFSVAVPKDPFYGRIVAKGHAKPPGNTGPRPIITQAIVNDAAGEILDAVTAAVARGVQD